MDRPLKGVLSEISFINLLLDVSESRLTGMIRLETGSVIKVVYMHQGGIAFASSNEKSDRLTEVLKRAGKLTPEQVEHAQARLKPNVSLGKTLVELGYINPKDLLWGARMQVEGILQQLLFWNQGNYQILEGPLPKEIVSLNMSVPQIIFDGILKTQDRQFILEHIGSPQSVFSLSPDFHEKSAQYKLPVEEVVSRMNGRRSLEEIAQTAGQETFDVCKAVAALQLLGMVQRKTEEPQPVPVAVAVDEGQQGLSADLDIMPVAPKQDISLGQLMQMPTVAELQQESAPREEEPFETQAPTMILQPAAEPGEPAAPTLISPPAEPEEEPFPRAEDAPAAPLRVITETEEEQDTENLPEATAAEQDDAEEEESETISAERTFRFEPPSFGGIEDTSVPMESLARGRRASKKSPYSTGVNWKKVTIFVAIVAVVAIGGTYFYTQAPWHSEKPEARSPVESKAPAKPAAKPAESVKPAEKPQPAPTEAKQQPVAPAASTPTPAPSKPAVAPTPAPSKPTPAPVSTPAKTAPAPAASTPLGLIQAGRISEAAAAYKKGLIPKRARYTIQLEIACQENTVVEAFQMLNNAAQLSVVPLDYKGKSCYRVLYGVYSSPGEADAARTRLPQDFLKQESPAQVIPLAKALK